MRSNASCFRDKCKKQNGAEKSMRCKKRFLNFEVHTCKGSITVSAKAIKTEHYVTGGYAHLSGESGTII